ncbi:MAG: helix-turn-helix domain-containing protein [Pseudomonas sp.]|nr:helix-turn-helix domain-containing protein [Pseudomonas sp.]
MSSSEIEESKKAAIAIKAARTAAGLSQVEFAKMISVSKATLARIETLEMPIRLEVYFNAVRELKKMGIEMDATSGEDIILKINPEGQLRIVQYWAEMSNRRVDKKR